MRSSTDDLLTFTERGIYCPVGDFYIDPVRKVDYAVITHAHSDHAYRGHRNYLAHHLSEGVLRLRLGQHISLQTVDYGEPVRRNGVTVTLLPAGHIIGSAQVKVAWKGRVWVVSGDYKIEDDGLCTPFEPIPCHVFVSESTFGLPIYRWKPQQEIFKEINDWWKNNRDAGKISVLYAYSLGKAQRLLRHLDASLGRIFANRPVEDTNAVLRKNGVSLPPTLPFPPEASETAGPERSRHYAADELAGGIVLCSPDALAGIPVPRYAAAHCSGWMATRKGRQWRPADKAFILSDHADWPGLNSAIASTGAERVFVTHGFSAELARYLCEKGLDAREINRDPAGRSREEAL